MWYSQENTTKGRNYIRKTNKVNYLIEVSNLNIEK